VTDLDPTTVRPEPTALQSGQTPDAATNARAVPIGLLPPIVNEPDDHRRSTGPPPGSSKAPDPVAFLSEWQGLEP
jgi:hypothetical protein